MPTLILASSSVYRQQMLARLRLPFTSVSPKVDETPLPGESPVDLAQRLALAKAQAVQSIHPDAIVIGADQVATIDHHTPIGKPHTFEKAFAQLQQLQGQAVAFHSAMAVVHGAQVQQVDVVTHVHFRTLTSAEIAHYLRVEAPFDTAGSAKAEGLGISLMERMVSDDPTAIIGLPLIALSRMLRTAGLNPTLQAQA